MRSYKIGLKKSGGRIPRIELEEIGPSIDWKGNTNFISLIYLGLRQRHSKKSENSDVHLFAVFYYKKSRKL
jgi:hypothetical protein